MSSNVRQFPKICIELSHSVTVLSHAVRWAVISTSEGVRSPTHENTNYQPHWQYCDHCLISLNFHSFSFTSIDGSAETWTRSVHSRQCKRILARMAQFRRCYIIDGVMTRLVQRFQRLSKCYNYFKQKVLLRSLRTLRKHQQSWRRNFSFRHLISFGFQLEVWTGGFDKTRNQKVNHGRSHKSEQKVYISDLDNIV